jgi:hypothetical protein
MVIYNVCKQGKEKCRKEALIDNNYRQIKQGINGIRLQIT